MSALWCMRLTGSLEMCETRMLTIQLLGSRSPLVAIAVFKGGTPPLVGEPVARESSGLHHRRAHPHACLALVGSSVPARPLSVRPKRTHLRYPQTTGHDRPQPSERGIALIAIYYVYAKELASQKPPIFKTGVNRHLIVCGLSTEADNTIVRFLCRS